MNQEKIGKFILKLRKEKNMTQQDLADKLLVSDKTISKWENGRGMPDLSLMMPLCDALNISINELLSGERLEKDNYQDKLEENIINTINYADKKMKKNNKIFKLIISLIIIIFLLITSMFFIDVKRMNEGKEVLFSTWGFKYNPIIDLHEEEINSAIKNYLIEYGDTNEVKTFVSMRIYLLEELENNKYNVYAYVKESKYMKESAKIEEYSSSSIPYKFVVEKSNDFYYVTDSRTPRDGSYYENDMKNIFPKSVLNDMDDFYNDGTSEKLDLELKEQVKLYFHK